MQLSPHRSGSQARINIFNRQGHVRTWDEIEREVLRIALVENGGSVLRAARSLGIGRNTLYRRLTFLNVAQPNDGIRREPVRTGPTLNPAVTSLR
jgi:transcriptional regulator of acetoin/glycerol metabolism